MEFKTSLDKLAKVVTAVITILFTAIIVLQLIFIQDFGNTSSIITITTLLISYLIAFIFRPISYIILDELLVIHRPLLDIKIALSEIENIVVLDGQELKGTIRTFGVGGLWGYWGRFANSRIGAMKWYATRMSNAVLITTGNNKKIVLTPDDPELFVEKLKSV
jgi:hypothetical protein